MGKDEKKEQVANEEYPTTFRDERGRDWSVRMTVPLVRVFCSQHRVMLNEFRPDKLDIGQILELAYEGTRYQTRAIAQHETIDEFLTALDGPSYSAAQEATIGAVVNFTLRTMSKQRREIAEKTIAQIMEQAGAGETSSVSPPTQG